MQLLNSTQIPNKILEAIFNNKFKPLEIRVLFFICRKTIGWHKETDWLTHNKIANALKTNKGNISKVLTALIKKEAITREGKEGNYNYGLNVKRWGLLDKQPRVVRLTTGGLLDSAPQKKLYTKETNTKDVASRPKADIAPVPKDGPIREANPLFKLMVWGEERRGQQFTNRGKQLKAIKQMKESGITGQQIIDRWEEMENDKFWKDKGFDFKNVADNFDRKPC